MIANRNILISGAGISGLTLAFWLQKWGFSPTLIEKRPNLQDPGYMIDFYGSGFDVAEKMGLVELLRARSDRYHMSRLTFVDDRGRSRATLDVERFRALLHQRYFPILRGDLESTLYETVRDRVPIRFGLSLREVAARPDGVIATFSDGTTQRYDLVIGADGIHSNVRRLSMGEEAAFSRFLGFYVACSVIDDLLHQPGAFLGHFAPNAQVMAYSIGEGKLATFFAFRSKPLNSHEREAQVRALASAMEGLGWVVPQLVRATIRAEDFFFDAAAQIQLDRWYVDRIALAGDACQCLTLLAGQGASMGMAGAYLLANELHKADGDHKVAFPAYQQTLQPEIERRQKDARGLAGSFVPRNKLEIALTHFFFNAAFWPGFSSLFVKQIGANSIIK